MNPGLDIGCGKTVMEGWDGLDKVNLGQKYIHDLEEIPWPIPDGAYKNLRAWNVLEHIHQDRVIGAMNECYRILEPGGKFHIKVPKFPHDNAVQDPTHFSFWVVKTFTLYFAGPSPRNAKYHDQLGRPMLKWGIVPKPGGGYEMDVDDRSIDIWLQR